MFKQWYEDKHYQRRKTDLENRLYKTYDKIDETEELLVAAKTKKRSVLTEKVTGDNIYVNGKYFPAKLEKIQLPRKPRQLLLMVKVFNYFLQS